MTTAHPPGSGPLGKGKIKDEYQRVTDEAWDEMVTRNRQDLNDEHAVPGTAYLMISRQLLDQSARNNADFDAYLWAALNGTEIPPVQQRRPSLAQRTTHKAKHYRQCIHNNGLRHTLHLIARQQQHQLRTRLAYTLAPWLRCDDDEDY